MKLRLITKKDIPQAASIVGKNYSKKWEKTSTMELHSMFSNAAIKPVYWVAEDKEKIIGFAGCIQSWMDYNIYQIFWVNVLPEYQRQGIGKKLVGKLIREIKKKKGVHLIQLTASIPNAGYYKHHFGFKTLIGQPVIMYYESLICYNSRMAYRYLSAGYLVKDGKVFLVHHNKFNKCDSNSNAFLYRS
jgi:ribosomal protein S18 acetylase RimI-like enzyme